MMSSDIRSPYFVNIWVDGFFMGFLSIGLFLYFRYLDLQGPFAPWQWTLAQGAIWALNWPHVFATSCRLYQSAEARRQYPLTAYVVPLFMLSLAIVAFAFPQEFAPYLVKVLLIWSPFHFSGQTIGITLLYARRSGIKLNPWMRFSVVGFAYCTFLSQICALESYKIDLPYHAISFPLLGIPKWTASVFGILSYGFAFALFLAAWQLQVRKIRLPFIVGLPLFVQYLWFVHGADVYSFQFFVSALHGLQYLLIAWSMQLALHHPWPTDNPLFFLIKKTALWIIFILLGGATLFYLLPLGLSLLGWEFSLASAIIFAILQYHHFFVDGVIWKLRDENVTRYLMGNILNMAKRGK